MTMQFVALLNTSLTSSNIHTAEKNQGYNVCDKGMWFFVLVKAECVGFTFFTHVVHVLHKKDIGQE